MNLLASEYLIGDRKRDNDFNLHRRLAPRFSFLAPLIQLGYAQLHPGRARLI